MANILTTKEFLACGDLEQRREFVERVGWNKILKDLDVKVIDKNENGTLIAVDLLGAELKFYKFLFNEKEFVVGVLPNIKTASEAQNWVDNGKHI